MRWLAIARVVPLVIYPFIVYLALEHVQAKYLAIVLLGVFVLRNRSKVRMLTDGLERAGALILAVIVLFAAAVWWSNAETLLLLYPVLLNSIMLGLFAFTLLRPPSMIERFARLQHPDLPPAAVHYTARVTQVWCGFFLINSLIAAYSAVFLSRAAWAFYNGFLAYVLMGALFLGEWLVRRYRFGRIATS